MPDRVRNDGLNRDEVKADILDRLLTDPNAWARLDQEDSRPVLRVNGDVALLDGREAKVIQQLLDGTEPDQRRWRR